MLMFSAIKNMVLQKARISSQSPRVPFRIACKNRMPPFGRNGKKRWFQTFASAATYQACIALCCESRAASFNASDRVGWAWKVKAISSAVPP